MHELGMCQGVVAALQERAAGRQVARLAVRVGAAHQVVPAAFRQAFELAALGTVAHGAHVEITIVPAGARCVDCQRDFYTDDRVPTCPVCGAVGMRVGDGHDLMLEWVEYAPDAADGHTRAAPGAQERG